MRHCILYILIVLVSSMRSLGVAATTSKVSPTPTCAPLTGVSIQLLPSEIWSYSYAGEEIVLTVAPRNGDWPTTPTRFRWSSPLSGNFDGNETETFVIPDPPPESVAINVRVWGEPPNPSCFPWEGTSVRNFTCVGPNCPPTGTPVPTPSPTPMCTYPPLDVCSSRVLLDPPRDQNGESPTSFYFSLEPPAEFAYIFEEGVTGIPHPFTEVSENLYYVENLDYDTPYLLGYFCEYIPCNNNEPMFVMSVISVIKEPEATPSPTPPSPTVTPTATLTTTTLTVTPTPTPFPSTTVMPTVSPTTGTMTVTPTPRPGGGWIFSGAQRDIPSDSPRYERLILQHREVASFEGDQSVRFDSIQEKE